MKYYSIKCLFLVLAMAVSAQASVILQLGDGVKFLGQVSGASEGGGGAFSWQITSTAAGPPSSPIGTDFETFCSQLQLSISPNSTYTISNIFTPTTGGTINTSGNTLLNMKGIYLFDLWNNNKLGSYISSNGSAAVAGAVQVAIWESEGYSSNNITGTGGFTTTQLNNANSLIPNLLTVTDVSGSYSTSWAPTDVSAFYLTHYGSGAQDQIVLVPASGQQSGSPTPEPASMIVWGIGAGLAGAAAVRRGKRRGGRWSKQNRQAILNVIERGRPMSKL